VQPSETEIETEQKAQHWKILLGPKGHTLLSAE